MSGWEGHFNRAVAVSAAVSVAAFGLAVTYFDPSAYAATTAVVRSPDAAGYTATDSSPVTNFTGGLNVASVTCPASGTVLMNANVNIIDPTSTYGVGFGWLITCRNGVAAYGPAAAEVFNSGGALSLGEVGIAGGDKLNFSMRNTGTEIKASLLDNSNKQGASASVEAVASLTDISAETTFSKSGTGTVSPIPSFALVIYSVLKFNGATLSSMSPTKVQMYDGPTLQVATSVISLSGSFKTTFKHS